jgi:hypothetical protein
MSDGEQSPSGAEVDRFGRTPEQKKADEDRLRAELAREREKHPDPTEPLTLAGRKRLEDGEDLQTKLARIRAQAEEADEERKRLPCFPFGEDDAGADACVAVEAHKSCRWRNSPDACPLARTEAFHEIIHRNLFDPAPAVRVPPREAAVIMASVRRKERVPLRKLDTLQVVRAALERKRIKVPLENGAEVRREPGEAKPARIPRACYFVGNEIIAVLAGNQGRGKTLAACYAIARMGGIYTHAPDWTRLKAIDVDAAIAAPVLVIDQFGREHFGDSKWALSQLENVLDQRSHSLSRWTFLVGNLTWELFGERLKDTTIVDRLSYGVFVEFGGDSIRAEMRKADLAGGSA